MRMRRIRKHHPASSSLALLGLFVCAVAGTNCVPAQTAQYTLRGRQLTATIHVDNGALKGYEVANRRDGATLKPGEPFALEFDDGHILAASQMKLDGKPVETSIAAKPNASRRAEQIPGRQLCADLTAQAEDLTAHWCAIERDGTNYLRQEVTIKAGANPAHISEVRIFQFAAPGAQVVGTVQGSPFVAGNFFFGFEFPLSDNTVTGGVATSTLKRILPLEAGQSITYSSVIGTAAPGQMRRDFLAYLEDERAHPYRTFLHYNTWYDLGDKDPLNEANVLDRIHALGEELVRKRGVKMDSFLFDDGWDDSNNLWHFTPGLPNGFTKIHAQAESYNFGIGVWFSPWGGYSRRKAERIADGEKKGYETVKGGFALSAPKYYNFFEQSCLDMISKYGVNQFKFDGTGNASQVFPGSLFDSDFSAMIHLIERLRQQEPNIFINLTTGTWPSPFWVRYSDTIWRGGADHSFAGVGTWRQKWITYRDSDVYKGIVQKGPLYPLNSLMLHGIIYGQRARNLTTDPGNDFPDEVHDYFGTGTQLQELYITPSLLSQQDWDVLAESAKWSRDNAAVLKDTHWIGGDPGKLEVYGYASWTPAKGILMLRNPSDKAQDFSLDIGKAFELPEHAARNYHAHSPWAADKSQPSLNLQAGKVETIHLAPFQVLTFDAMPAK